MTDVGGQRVPPKPKKQNLHSSSRGAATAWAVPRRHRRVEHTLAAPGSPVEPLANSQKAFAGCKESQAKIGASVIDILAKFKDTLRWRQKSDPNSEYILVVRRDQIFQSSGPGTYPRASRKAPPTTFADESFGLPKYTSDWRRHLPSKWYIISTPAQFSSTIDGTGADGPRSEGGRRILLDNSRVYVRFLPFVSGRVHLGRISGH